MRIHSNCSRRCEKKLKLKSSVFSQNIFHFDVVCRRLYSVVCSVCKLCGEKRTRRKWQLKCCICKSIKITFSTFQMSTQKLEKNFHTVCIFDYVCNTCLSTIIFIFFLLRSLSLLILSNATYIDAICSVFSCYLPQSAFRFMCMTS